MGSFTGYNCEKVVALRETINATATNAASGIVSKLGAYIVVPMSTAWYAPEAQEFFKVFADVVASLGEEITAVFDNFRVNVETFGKYWAEQTKGEIPVLKAIDPVELKLNVEAIKGVNTNGDVYIDETEALRIASNLTVVESEIESNLKQLAANLNAETAFLGGTQSEEIANCFQRVSGSVHKIFKFLTEDSGENKSLKTIVREFVTKYQDISKHVSQQFQSDESNN